MVKKQERTATIAVIGLGTIGLATAVTAAARGFKVIGIDIDPERLEKIKRVDPSVIEKPMLTLLEQQINSGHLQVANCLTQRVDYILLNLPTGLTQANTADLQVCLQAIEQISAFVTHDVVVINESTVNLDGNLELVRKLETLTGLICDQDFYFVYGAERLFPGNALQELISNDRILGGISKVSCEKAVQFYQEIVQGDFYLTDFRTAELVKLTENSYRYLQIAFANQLESICQELGLNVHEVIKMANLHPRVKILSPGIGVGGACLPLHPHYIAQALDGKMPTLLAEAVKINQEKVATIIEQIKAKCAQLQYTGVRKRPKVLLMGATYKVNVRDTRNSPAIAIAQALEKIADIDVYLVDPLLDKAWPELPKCFVSVKFDVILPHADVVAILVEHPAFSELGLHNLDNKLIVDPLNALSVWQAKKTKSVQPQTNGA